MKEVEGLPQPGFSLGHVLGCHGSADGALELAGVGILLALRSALTGGAWTSVAGWLAGALVAHLADVARRWRADR